MASPSHNVTAALWLDELNPAQREAVTHGDGPLLIVAGAGTGKTKTLACRVAWLIQNGVRPDRILLLTFTRRAAAEMIGRAERLMTGAQPAAQNAAQMRPGDSGESDLRGASGQTSGPARAGASVVGKVWGGTFHAVSNRLLRMYGQALGLRPDFTVMDEADAADLMNLIRNEQGHSRGDRRFPRKETLLSIYSRTVNAQEKLRDVLEKQYPWCIDDYEGIQAILEQYVQRKPEQNVLDYDDLLLYWSVLCETPVGQRVADRFDHILVDEYQDTNAIQSRILAGMRPASTGPPGREQPRPRNMCVVGDDAQSIYSFRAATVRNILDFPKEFPGTRIVTLEQNYRSTQPILAASNAVMEYATERYTKNLWSERKSDQKPVLVTCIDETEQSEAVCGNILGHLERGMPLMRQAVLFRAGHHSALLEIELARRNIPFHKYGGLKFVEAAHIKDVLAFLRILENPFDEISWFRVLQMLEGVGPRTARRIMDELGVRGRITDGRRAPAASQTTSRARSGSEGPRMENEGSREEPPAPADAPIRARSVSDGSVANLAHTPRIATQGAGDRPAHDPIGTPSASERGTHDPVGTRSASERSAHDPVRTRSASERGAHDPVGTRSPSERGGEESVRPRSSTDSQPGAPGARAGFRDDPPEPATFESRDEDRDEPAGLGISVDSPIWRFIHAPVAFPPAAKTQAAHLRAALADCSGVHAVPAEPSPAARSPRQPPLSLQVERIRRFYQPIFERRYDNPIIRLRDLEQLEAIAARYRSRARFITDLTLDPPSATSDLAQPPHLDEDWLTLSTIHSAKGCEWDAVHVLHAADGMIPSDMAVGDSEGVDEERRLFYVAMTRARDHLYVYFPLRYYHRRFGLADAHGYAQLTRFIPPPVRSLFEDRPASGAPSSLASDAGLRTGSASDNSAEALRARLRSLFRE